MLENPYSATARSAASLALALALAYGLLVVFYPFILPVATGGVVALISRPLYDTLNSRIKSPGLASLITTLIVIAAIAIPVALLGLLLVREVGSVSGSLGNHSPYLEALESNVTGFLARFGVHVGHIDVRSYALNAIDLVRARSTELLSSAFGVLGSSLITLVSCFYLLQNHETIHAHALDYSPLKRSDTELIMRRAREVLGATIRGNLVLTVLQSISCIISLLLFGVGSPILIGLLYGVASFVPTIGVSLVWIPVMLYEISIGRPWAGIGVAVWSMAQVVIFDNYLGPRLIERRANLHPFLILMGVLGGIAQFGILGIILGPTVVALGIVGLEILRRTWQPAED
jgi:predicted PurR-regulated permease PerM